MLFMLRIYRAEFKTRLIVQFHYRVATLIWLISWVVEPIVYLAIWSTVARASGGQVGGFAAEDFAAYFIMTMLVNHFTYTWIMFEYEYYIRNGTLSALLLRPLHPIHKDLAENLANKVLTLVAIIPLTLILMLAFQPALSLTLWTGVALVPALLLAYALRFLVEWTLAMAAFWVTRVAALNQLYFVMLLFFSGQLAPLALLPEPLRLLATLLPFRWMIAFPVELSLGRLTPTAILLGFAAQGTWLLLSLAGLLWVWRNGLRRYSAVGA